MPPTIATSVTLWMGQGNTFFLSEIIVIVIPFLRISDDKDFIETTSDTECTQYSMRDCSRY